MHDESPKPDTDIARRRAKAFVKGMALVMLGTPLVLGVAWAGDFRPESWISALIGLLILVGVVMTSGSNGFYVVDDD